MPVWVDANKLLWADYVYNMKRYLNISYIENFQLTLMGTIVNILNAIIEISTRFGIYV